MKTLFDIEVDGSTDRMWSVDLCLMLQSALSILAKMSSHRDTRPSILLLSYRIPVLVRFIGCEFQVNLLMSRLAKEKENLEYSRIATVRAHLVNALSYPFTDRDGRRPGYVFLFFFLLLSSSSSCVCLLVFSRAHLKFKSYICKCMRSSLF